jgi:S-formylglutathione hydrolase FrmB
MAAIETSTSAQSSEAHTSTDMLQLWPASRHAPTQSVTLPTDPLVPPPTPPCRYDTVSEVYSTFLETEILPVVEQHANISSDPLDRAICGASSGGIAAFSAAWFRPDLFSRVMSHIGYVCADRQSQLSDFLHHALRMLPACHAASLSAAG